MFHIEHDPSILEEINKGLDSVQNVDYEKVFEFECPVNFLFAFAFVID